MEDGGDHGQRSKCVGPCVDGLEGNNSMMETEEYGSGDGNIALEQLTSGEQYSTRRAKSTARTDGILRATSLVPISLVESQRRYNGDERVKEWRGHLCEKPALICQRSPSSHLSRAGHEWRSTRWKSPRRAPRREIVYTTSPCINRHFFSSLFLFLLDFYLKI